MLDALRRQLAENLERMRKAGRLSVRAGGAAAATPARAAPLDAVLARRLAAIDRRSPEGLAAAMRVFVESALVGEFGEELLSNAGFGQLIDDVGAAMREDPQVRASLDRMFEEL